MYSNNKISIEIHHHEVARKKAVQKDKLRVAAYCRVSTLSEQQEDSFDVQCAYYEKLINADPKMELIGIYADQGVSGLSTKGRTEFARLMHDCEAGKIDMVITRSVSRLSRNMVECVETVNKLKDLGIPVRFEKEGLTTTDTGSELFFHILAVFAQQESNSISQRMSWAYEQRASLGVPVRACAYGYKKEAIKPDRSNIDSRAWLVKEDEAKRVRMAFELAADLYSYQDILHELNKIEELEGTGVYWKQERLYRMLKNEVYCGDILTGKHYKADYIDKKLILNCGERVQYYIEKHHEPLVSREIFERVNRYMDAGLLHSCYIHKREEFERSLLRSFFVSSVRVSDGKRSEGEESK